MDLRQIKVNEDDFGMMAYDPAFTNTASCRSSITYIDGEAGILQHRGIPIEQLCEKSTYLEVAFLLVYGELPTARPARALDLRRHPPHLRPRGHQAAPQGFRYDAHPMGMLLASVGALSTFYPDAKQIDDPQERYMAAVRLIAKMPTLAAFAYRHNMGLPYVYPDNDLSFSENFLSMMFKKTEVKYEPDPRLAKALDVLFILHADHEQNCSTNAVRAVGSSQVDPYSAVAAGVAALYGPLHGGANEAVLRMLRRIETTDNIPGFLEGVKNREEKLMGFGHRVYKNYDPRARIIKKHVDEVLEATEYNPLIEIATELEKQALDDEYFTSRKLYPNVDFYSGPDLRGARAADRAVHGDVRDPADRGLGRAVAGDDRGPRDRRSPARARSTPGSATSTTRRSASARDPRRSPTTRCAVRFAGAAAPRSPGAALQAHNPARPQGRAAARSTTSTRRSPSSSAELEARGAGRLPRVSMLRDFEPGDRVAARLELSTGGVSARRAPPAST